MERVCGHWCGYPYNDLVMCRDSSDCLGYAHKYLRQVVNNFVKENESGVLASF